MDFQLYPADLPSLSTYEASDLTQKPRVGNFWPAAECVKTLDGKCRFITYAGIPCLYANSERGFSMKSKFHTGQRLNLAQSTIMP